MVRTLLSLVEQFFWAGLFGMNVAGIVYSIEAESFWGVAGGSAVALLLAATVIDNEIKR